MKSSETTQPKRRGRPRVEPEARVNNYPVKITADSTKAQRDKYLALGGASWLREQIEKARLE